MAGYRKLRLKYVNEHHTDFMYELAALFDKYRILVDGNVEMNLHFDDGTERPLRVWLKDDDVLLIYRGRVYTYEELARARKKKDDPEQP